MEGIAIRLILFDIDGTLLWPGRTPKKCLADAMMAVFGTCGDIEHYSFGGKTDPQIVCDLMSGAGLSEPAIAGGLCRVFEEYLRLLNRDLKSDDMELYPATRPLLEVLSPLPGVMIGLVTGNVKRGAMIKLQQFDLGGFFRIGAFGSDSADRNVLPALARERAEAILGSPVSPGEVVILGDSPYDVRCARACGAKAIAVATGRTPLEALAEEHPDALFRNLNDTDEVLQTLLNI